MELLDNLERHFFVGVHANPEHRSKESLYADPDNVTEDTAGANDPSASEKRRDLLRKMTKARVSASNQGHLKALNASARSGYLSTSHDSFPTVNPSTFYPRFSHSNRAISKSFRERLSMSDQNLTNFSQTYSRSGLERNSASCTNLHLQLTNRSSTEDLRSSKMSHSGRASVTLPLLSSRSKDIDGEKTMSMARQRTEVKLPTVYPSQLSTVEDEPSPRPEKQQPKDWGPPGNEVRPLDIRDCVTPTRTAIFNVEHNWILSQDYDKAMRKINHLSKTLVIPLPDKEADIAIRQRLKEVQAMVTRRAELWQVWELMSDEQKNKILVSGFSKMLLI